MAILVTGGAGYIGSHAARALRRSGYEVVLYDNLSAGFRRLAQGFELVEGDIADEARLRPVLARVDAVMVDGATPVIVRNEDVIRSTGIDEAAFVQHANNA